MIVGDGDDRCRLEEKVMSLGRSDQIIFTGKISGNEKATHFCMADSFVIPSQARGLVSCFSKLLHAVFR
jgi:glycosyltransferase involved in cell wall biosynthesis